MTGFTEQYKRPEGKMVGIDLHIGNETFKAGKIGDYSKFCRFDKPVRYIEISAQSNCKVGQYRAIYFYDADGKRMDWLYICRSIWPESYEGDSKKIPEGYDLIGFAIANSPDGTINCISFTCWKKPPLPVLKV